jgi:hypothetical protein
VQGAVCIEKVGSKMYIVKSHVDCSLKCHFNFFQMLPYLGYEESWPRSTGNIARRFYKHVERYICV